MDEVACARIFFKRKRARPILQGTVYSACGVHSSGSVTFADAGGRSIELELAQLYFQRMSAAYCALSRLEIVRFDLYA